MSLIFLINSKVEVSHDKNAKKLLFVRH